MQTQSSRRPTREAVKALAAACIGNFVEWYDFAIYAYSVPVIATLFFPQGSRTSAILAAFALWGVAFLARPLGGVFWGNLGDRVGRRNTLARVVLLMGGGTMLIGLLPTYAQIGLLAPVLLAILRLVQGFSVGGEATGATSFITEYAPEGRRGLFAAILGSTTALPLVLGGLTVLVATALLPEGAYGSWGWRLPFLIGGPLALVGLYIRLKMCETPTFEEIKSEEQIGDVPALEAVRYHFRKIALVFAITSLYGLVAYILAAYFVTYLIETVGLDATTAILSNVAGGCALVLLLPFVGALGDRIGRKPLLLIGCAGCVVLSVPGFMIAGGGSLGTAILGQLLVALPFSFVAAAVVITQVEIFPTRVRYSAAAIGYNVGIMAFGGTAPLAATALVAQTGSAIAPGVYLVVVAMVVFFVTFALPETYRLPLLREGEGSPTPDPARKQPPEPLPPDRVLSSSNDRYNRASHTLHRNPHPPRVRDAPHPRRRNRKGTKAALRGSGRLPPAGRKQGRRAHRAITKRMSHFAGEDYRFQASGKHYT